MGIGKVVGYGEVDAGLVACRHKAVELRPGAPRQHHGGLAGGFVHHAHVLPEHAAAETGAERLGTGLLGGEALGIGGGALGALLGFADLDIGEDAVDEARPETGEGFLDAPDVDHVIADADDHLRPRLPGLMAGMAASSGGSLSAA